MDTQAAVLDIAMNLNRMGNWAADDYPGKKKRIVTFLDNTSACLHSFQAQKVSGKFKKTYDLFIREYKELEQAGRHGPQDSLAWAEQMMTWGNILTHRSKLL